MIKSCEYCNKVYDTEDNKYTSKVYNGDKLPDYKEYTICPVCKNINCIYIINKER